MGTVVSSRLGKANRGLSLLYWPITSGLMAKLGDLAREAKG
jgi:hypothetical protein